MGKRVEEGRGGVLNTGVWWWREGAGRDVSGGGRGGKEKVLIPHRVCRIMAEMFRNWICEAIERMLTEFDSEGMNIEGWRCVGINDKGIKEYVVVDGEDRIMFSCEHIEDAEFYIKMFKMRKWEDVNIINMCERKNDAQ